MFSVKFHTSVNDRSKVTELLKPFTSAHPGESFYKNIYSQIPDADPATIRALVNKTLRYVPNMLAVTLQFYVSKKDGNINIAQFKDGYLQNKVTESFVKRLKSVTSVLVRDTGIRGTRFEGEIKQNSVKFDPTLITTLGKESCLFWSKLSDDNSFYFGTMEYYIRTLKGLLPYYAGPIPNPVIASNPELMSLMKDLPKESVPVQDESPIKGAVTVTPKKEEAPTIKVKTEGKVSLAVKAVPEQVKEEPTVPIQNTVQAPKVEKVEARTVGQNMLEEFKTKRNYNIAGVDVGLKKVFAVSLYSRETEQVENFSIGAFGSNVIRVPDILRDGFGIDMAACEISPEGYDLIKAKLEGVLEVCYHEKIKNLAFQLASVLHKYHVVRVGFEDQMLSKASCVTDNDPKHFQYRLYIAIMKEVLKRCEEFGIQVIPVETANTTRICTHCGSVAINPVATKKETVCPVCKKDLNKDTNASLNIMYRAIDKILHNR